MPISGKSRVLAFTFTPDTVGTLVNRMTVDALQALPNPANDATE